jgi:hypothetical protein
MVPTDKHRQLSQEGRKQWSLLSDTDRSVLLQPDSPSTSTLMDSYITPRSNFHRPGERRPFNKDRKVNWAEQEASYKLSYPPDRRA